MQKEGASKGVPDLFLAVPASHIDWAGLWIEMKSPKGKLSAEQKDWHQRLKSHGYAVMVCRSAREAILTICEYLRLPWELKI